MESYTLTTASQAARKSKSTILRAIQKGRLSATRTDNGGWLIDPSELHRAFSNALHVPHAQHSTEPSNALQPRNALQARLEATEARLTDARELIETLWRRLDRADEERRQVQARLDAVLTDQRTATPARVPDSVAPAARRRGWWRFGR